MSSYLDVYCNTNTDLINIVPNLGEYDRKIVLDGLTTDSGSLYRKDNSGYVSQLYRDQQDLGAAQASKVACTADGEWFYDSAEDVVYLYSDTAPASMLVEAGIDWDDLKTRMVQEASEQLRSFINRPIFKRIGTGQQAAQLRDYDWIIYHSAALLACALLIAPYDSDFAAELRRKAIDDDSENATPMGLLDRLKRGEFKLWHEPSQAKAGGVIGEISIDSSTTGGILQTRGKAEGVSWDDVKVIITQGGTITPGSANSTVTYSVYVKTDEGLQMQLAVEDEVIDCGFQALAYGLFLRFAPGVYNTDDAWVLTVTGIDEERPSGIQVVELERY